MRSAKTGLEILLLFLFGKRLKMVGWPRIESAFSLLTSAF